MEAVVIGAGVVGLAVARALARKGKEVLIIERAPTIGSGTYSHQNETSGIDISTMPCSSTIIALLRAFRATTVSHLI